MRTNIAVSAVSLSILLLPSVPSAYADGDFAKSNELRGLSLRLINSTEYETSKTRLRVNPSVSSGGPHLQGADPFVLKAFDGSSYLYTTNRPGANVPVYHSSNLAEWLSLGDALPTLPIWAERGHTWAPEVIGLKTQEYLLFFTARDKVTGKQCIGRAKAPNPAGPFLDRSLRPFICNSDTETSIDPSPFRDDDGTIYLLWKTKETDQNNQDVSKIWIQALTAKGQIDSKQDAKAILINDQPWEGKHIEAPTLIRRNGKYILFYSAGASTVTGYAISYAVAASIRGPYKRIGKKPFIAGTNYLRGPGHQSLYRTGANSFVIFFHSVRPERKKSRNDKARYVGYSYLCFDGIRAVAQDTACKLP